MSTPRNYVPVAAALVAALFLFGARAARAQEPTANDPNRVPALTSFGPVTLAAIGDDGAQGLRLCHANLIGDSSVRVAWVLYQMLGGGTVGPVLREVLEVPSGTGGCVEWTSSNKLPVTIIGVLAQGGGPRWQAPSNVLGSAQRIALASDGSVRFLGELLPAVNKVNVSWVLPALPSPQPDGR